MYLNCHTYFSLRYGVLSPQRLVEEAAARGIDCLALTDINNTSCAVEFVTHCRKQNIRPILGITFHRQGKWLYTGLARNADGWHNLCKLLSDYSLDDKSLPEVAPPLADVWIVYPHLAKPICDFRDNELLGIRPRHVNRQNERQIAGQQGTRQVQGKKVQQYAHGKEDRAAQGPFHKKVVSWNHKRKGRTNWHALSKS